MGKLDDVERGIERAVNGLFARTFRSGVQPVEIAAGLRRELDIGSVIVDRDRTLAPNRFVVRVSAADAKRLINMGGTLERELIGVVNKHAKRQGYRLLGEADSPFLSPRPHRGKPNTPAYVRHTAEALATLLGMAPEAMEARLDANAERFFGLSSARSAKDAEAGR